MELHHHSCVLPSNAPALSEPDSSIPSRVLQERSANKRHGYPEGSTSWKPPSSPTENIYSRQLGSYFAGNIATQLSGEKSEAQIEHETRRLMALLRRCEKYQKYRDRQPQTAKEKEHRWPDYLEEAFFRGMAVSLPALTAWHADAYLSRLGPMAAYGPAETDARWTASRAE